MSQIANSGDKEQREALMLKHFPTLLHDVEMLTVAIKDEIPRFEAEATDG